MKYQSELIKEIIDMRGHDKSSHHYESECIESWIAEHKGAYPKLCDYQSEWLSYVNKNEGGGTDQPDPEPPIGEFPYVVLSDVTEATLHNVVPYAYKSAILKGKTDENLQSVKMPVLKAMGENIIGECINPTETKKQYKAYLKPNTNYTLSYKNTDGSSTGAGKVYLKNGDTEIASYGYKHQLNFTTPSTINSETLLCINARVTDISVMLVEGTVPYTDLNLETILKNPYKANILTVNEDVTLRGIGDIKDELNLLTGEVTNRIGEIILNGAENWSTDSSAFTNTYRFMLKIDDMVTISWHELIKTPPFVKSNTFRSLDLRTEVHNLDTEHLTGWDFSNIVLNISKEKLSEFSVDALKTYIRKNPITVQYQLATESTKTVDLTIVNQDGENVSL